MKAANHEERFPWGRASFDEEPFWEVSSKQPSHYREDLEKALSDPHYDYFQHHIPTRRPKYDIGRYVASHSIPVPLIQSMEQWRQAFLSGTAMLRSELRQDYDGFSGLLRSHTFSLRETFPKDEMGREDFDEPWIGPRRYEGPPLATINLGDSELLQDRYADYIQTLGSTAFVAPIRKQFTDGLYNGNIDPAAFMRLTHWQRDFDRIVHHVTSQKLSMPDIGPSEAETSRWQYIPGVNIRVFRDPVIEGKYFIGGRESHHHWQITDGRDTPDLEAHPKSVYRGYQDKGPDTLEYSLPTRKIIDTYEKIRQLPLFDNRQAPLMEMQYGDDGELYFLQYLKTGHQISPTAEFSLPTGEDIVTVHDVRGATKPEGEKVKIYLDPRKFGRKMTQQAFYVELDLSQRSYAIQFASLVSRVMIVDYFLSFKDNHFDSAPLTRAPVALGLYDDVGEAEERFRTIHSPYTRQRRAWDEVIKNEYINAIVTSNGRKATIASDWQVRSEYLN